MLIGQGATESIGDIHARAENKAADVSISTRAIFACVSCRVSARAVSISTRAIRISARASVTRDGSGGAQMWA